MRSDSPGIGRMFYKPKPLPTDSTLFGQVLKALVKELPNNKISFNNNGDTIWIDSISTNVIHEITIKRTQ